MRKLCSPFGWVALGMLVFWVLVGGVCIAKAAPFLTTDCTPAVDQITGFQLQFGTQTAIDIPAMQTCLSQTCTGDAKVICYDLGTMPVGAFSVKASARNSWGVSDWTPPLSGTKQLPGSPLLLKISP